MTNGPDVLVIGGGIIGASCAYYLAREGAQVTLIEREEAICPVDGATYANAGLVMPSDPYPLPAPGVLGQGLKWLLDSSSPLYIRPRPSPALARWLAGFAVASRESTMRRHMPVLRSLGIEGIKAFDELHSSGELDGGYHHNGILTLYLARSKFEAAAADADVLRASFAVQSEALGAAVVRERVPAALPGVAGGILHGEDAHADACAFTRELARLAARQGATVLTATEALDFRLAGRRVAAVTTTRGTVAANTVVLAAGVWSAALARPLGLRLPLQPAKGYSVTVPRPAGVPEDLPLYLPEGHVCVTPYGEHLRLAGTLELSGINDRVLANRLQAIRAGAGRFLEGAATGEPLQIWRGLRPMTPDGLPIVGRARRLENLVLATGHNMNGLMYGPITGRLVAEMVAGRAPSLDIHPLRAERFTLL
jgi:D-amino-acid dehydrogenase